MVICEIRLLEYEIRIQAVDVALGISAEIFYKEDTLIVRIHPYLAHRTKYNFIGLYPKDRQKERITVSRRRFCPF